MTGGRPIMLPSRRLLPYLPDPEQSEGRGPLTRVAPLARITGRSPRTCAVWVRAIEHDRPMSMWTLDLLCCALEVPTSFLYPETLLDGEGQC